MKRAFPIIVVLACLFSLSPAVAAPPAGQPDDSLYVALGEKAGISAIVDTTLSHVADDQRIVHYFANTNIVHVRHGLITKLCVVAGGPCHYTGHNMADVHRGLHITAAAFNAMVEDLRAAMTQLKVPLTAQNRLLAQLAPMRNDIVESSQRD